jgi:hypothetical protein
MIKKWDATSEHLLRKLTPQVLGAVAFVASFARLLHCNA